MLHELLPVRDHEQVDSLCSALQRNRTGEVMRALRERGVGESKVLGQWWGRSLYLGGRACINLGDNEEAIKMLKKALKVSLHRGGASGGRQEPRRFYPSPVEDALMCWLFPAAIPSSELTPLPKLLVIVLS